MKLNGERIKRTAIQSAAGAGVALLTAVMADFSVPAVIAAFAQFAGTVAMAVLMNIKKQAEEMGNENND